jgi:predicted secreted protein
MHPINFIKIGLSFLLTATLAAACGGETCPDAADDPASLITVDESQANDSVLVDVGSTVKISLEGNPTTGYRWQLASSEGLPLTDTSFEPHPSAPTTVGESGDFIFLFAIDQAAAGQSFDLEFAYYRPWEGLSAAIETFTITIEVNGQSPDTCEGLGGYCAPLVSGGVAECKAGFVADAQSYSCGAGQVAGESTRCCVPDPEPAVIEIDESRANTTVEVAASSTVRIRLAGNPTTGYEWKLVDDGGLALSDESYEPLPAAKHIVGTGGHFSFEFDIDAANAGKSYQLELAYYRSWEGVANAIDRFNVTLQVK